MFASECKKVEGLNSEQERLFWIEFLFEMTIVGRLFWGHPDELKQVNEIDHRVLNRIRDLADEDQWSSSDYVPNHLVRHVSLAPKLEESVRNALDRALKRMSD